MQALKKITHRQMIRLDKDLPALAKAVNLVYVTDTQEGIERLKKGDQFQYMLQHKPVKDEDTLSRIKKLAIPPAWTNVWICCYDNGHLQATGYDAMNRKQYRYHALWSYLRGETKFHRLLEFGKALPQLRLKMEKDIARKELDETKVIAAVIAVMERTYIRIGSEDYEKLYGSYGLTTLKDKHVSINGNKVKFSFRGKKGIHHDITFNNSKLAKIIKDCRDIPGKELFQYYTEDGGHKSVDSAVVNQYIKEATGGDFTAKDFRTWAGSLHILRSLSMMEQALDEKTRKSNIVVALDQVSGVLGNTRSVCRKYYVHPSIITMYEEDRLHKYLQQLNSIEKDDDKSGLTTEEQVLMKVLQSHT